MSTKGQTPTALDVPAGSALLTADILGHPSDFLITQKRYGDQIKITVKTVMPAIRWDADRQCLLTWAPPRHPWPNIKMSHDHSANNP